MAVIGRISRYVGDLSERRMSIYSATHGIEGVDVRRPCGDAGAVGASLDELAVAMLLVTMVTTGAMTIEPNGSRSVGPSSVHRQATVVEVSSSTKKGLDLVESVAPRIPRRPEPVLSCRGSNAAAAPRVRTCEASATSRRRPEAGGIRAASATDWNWLRHLRR